MQWHKLVFGWVVFCSWTALGQTGKKPVKTLEKSAENSAANILFPDWSPEGFDWNLGLIGGVRARETEADGQRIDVISSELGLGARVAGIPVVLGNPGMTIQPYGSYTWGNRTEKVKDAELDTTESSGFQRSWYGVVGRFYYRAFRYSLDLGQGQIHHDKDLFTDITAKRLQNDFGLLILSFFSTHYTLTSLTVTESGESKPSIDEIDHWLHARLAFSLFDFNVDVGPGVSSTHYSGRTAPGLPFAKVAHVTSQYFKALSSMHLFWKLGASGSAKYIVHSDKDVNIGDGIEQLPYEGLAQSKSIAVLPDGSLEASAFIGLRDLFAGFGVGWQYYYLEQASTPKQITRNQGFALVYNSDIK